MNESNILGLSIRGIIAVIVVITLCFVCAINPTDTKIGILKDIALIILSFYYGQKSSQGGQNASNTNSNNTSNSANDSQSGQPKP